MELFKLANKTGDYNYFHLMSGQDLCIKSQREIHKFFEDNPNKNFLTFCGQDWQDNIISRVKYYYIESGRNKYLGKINSLLIRIQKILKINRLKNIKLNIVGGSNWCSLSRDFVNYLIDNEKNIKKIFNHGFCVDELFVHTMAYNSKFKDTIHLLKIPSLNDNTDADMYNANLRYIDWNRGSPYIFKEEDFEDLIDCSYLFARKFSSSSNNHVSKRIIEYNKTKE